MDKNVVCSFYKKCQNYKDLCDHCKWNANNEIQDYLLIEDSDGKSLKFL